MRETHIQRPSQSTTLFWTAFIIFAWAGVHAYSVFFHPVFGAPIIVTLAVIALQIWLYAGLFIVAHDTMHGTVFQNHPKANARLGTLILFFYAGFNWKFLQSAHIEHHKHPGTDKDPDFNAANPTAFWVWYFKFFRHYFGLKQVLILNVFTLVYMFIFGAQLENILIMWALPAILSSVQLFLFGTYLTHKHADSFPDHHNARSNDYPVWLSLLTCFHFGYHHEHHLYPHEPWWRLPLRRRLRLQEAKT